MRKAVSFLAVGWLAVSSAMVFAQDANVSNDLRQIRVVGVGQVSVVPDMAQISVGVQTRSESAALAMDGTNEKLATLIEVLSTEGVAATDRQTGQISLHTEFGRLPTEEPTAKQTYVASNTLTIRHRDLDTAPKILDALVQSGANQIYGFQLMVQDKAPHVDEARKRAIRDALDKATLYAQAADLKLGRVLQIDEQPQSSAPLVAYGAAIEADRAVPIAAGEQNITAEIVVILELLDR